MDSVTPAPIVKRRSAMLVAALAAAGGLGAGVLVGTQLLPGVGREAREEAAGPVATMTLEGTLTLNHEESAALGGCRFGLGGYDDIQPGTQVTVTDRSGDILGVGELGLGRTSDLKSCDFAFTVEDIPQGQPFYGVEVANRGVIRKSLAELEADDFSVQLTLG